MKYRFLKNGFTLPEVCVAVLVLGFGISAICCYIRGFEGLQLAERKRAEQFVEAVKQMETLIENPPVCPDSVFKINHLKLEPAPMKMAVATISMDYVQIKRLVKCEKDTP